MRASGVLLPIASLPSEYGIGCFSKEAYLFVDQLVKAGQKYWQILPLGPTGYGDSPYQSFSTFAGNPYFIDLNDLIEKRYLTKEECEACDFGNNDRYIDYEKIYFARFDILKKAYQTSEIEKDKKFQEFIQQNKYWLNDYSHYMAIKNYFHGISWIEWDEEIRLRKNIAMEAYGIKLQKEIEFYQFLQYIFYSQWNSLKYYANQKGIKIIGDIPIYVAFDSADCWANRELFQFNEENVPIAVAGCPPDAFSMTGQLWGNPLYDWDYHKKTDYAWWMKRIEHCFELYDVVRVDHFRGFDEYYTIPYGAKDATFGEWKKGPGYQLFEKLDQELGKLDIIAEDLGFVTDSVRKLLDKTGYPGMKVLQFAFDSREESDYLPHNYNQNSIVYTGTHDNNTILGWYDSISQPDKRLSIEYLNNAKSKPEEISWDFIRLAMESVAKTCIIPIQDYLGFGSEARINTPSTLGENWKWRLKKGDLDEKVIKKIYDMTKLYGRL